eukprot:456763-Rhodomonas_salina.2
MPFTSLVMPFMAPVRALMVAVLTSFMHEVQSYNCSSACYAMSAADLACARSAGVKLEITPQVRSRREDGGGGGGRGGRKGAGGSDV